MNQVNDIFEISKHFIKVIFPFFGEKESNIANDESIGDDNGDEMKIL